MKRNSLLVVVLLSLAVVAGCASAPSSRSNYDAYADLVLKHQEAESAAISSIATAAQACTDARCVEHVAAVAALAASGGRGGSTIAPPPRELSGAEKFAQVFGSLSPFLGTVVNGAVSWRQSDNATRQAQAQYDYLGTVLSTALNGMSSVAISATPSITVGGNLGDTYGDNYTGRDRTDVAGHLVNGSAVIGDRNFNSGRQDSAGPFDRTCTGDACQPVDNGGDE